jgi:3-oxoacyl-[acyl-carrier protein] reductase
MELGLTGRTALVMGASSGLGLASAQALHEEGANVVMLARREELLRQEAERISATPVVGDVHRTPDLERAIQTAAETHGGLDILVLNGGGPPPGSAQVVSEKSIQQSVSLLLKPVVAAVNAALPHLRASGQGRIISISSVSVREPVDGLALSNAVRPGVWGYLKTLSRELAQGGITVNLVAPGRIATARLTELFGGDLPPSAADGIPAGRLGRPEELGAVVCFLASARASYLNGVLIPVDGGLSRSL